MNVDKAPANSRFSPNRGSGDTGWRRVEHRNISELRITQ